MKKQTSADHSLEKGEILNRSWVIDFIRALAIILMVFFHTSYDLNLFRLISIESLNSGFWWFLPRLIVFLFLLAVAMSSREVNQHGIRWRTQLKRLAKIVLGAAAVSTATYYLFPGRWIYFGTLHCIALISIAVLPFLRFPTTAGIVGLLILISKWGFNIGPRWFTLPHQSLDYIPFYPWVGVAGLGLWLHHLGLAHWPVEKKLMELASPKNQHFIQQAGTLMRFMGKHSLVIYLLHQPIIYGLLLALAKIIH